MKREDWQRRRVKSDGSYDSLDDWEREEKTTETEPHTMERIVHGRSFSKNHPALRRAQEIVDAGGELTPLDVELITYLLEG